MSLLWGSRVDARDEETSCVARAPLVIPAQVRVNVCAFPGTFASLLLTCSIKFYTGGIYGGAVWRTV